MIQKIARSSITKMLAAIVIGGNAWAAAPAGRYVRTDITVADTVTGLTWQRHEPQATYYQSFAASYCSGLTLGGQGGWRLPTIKELQTIVEVRVGGVDTLDFPDTHGYANPHFWSSTASWVVDFTTGSIIQHLNLEAHVRCVK